jgi:dCTP deaminase
MSVLSDVSLLDLNLQHHIIQVPGEEYDINHYLNPASIDIRIGKTFLCETYSKFSPFDLPPGFVLLPGEFMLVSTYETIHVPNGYAMELKLKSSIARQGFNHSLAFWVDPGWKGILTMEIQNVTNYQCLRLNSGMRFAQIIFHELTSLAARPYNGKYQHASSAEVSKS